MYYHEIHDQIIANLLQYYMWSNVPIYGYNALVAWHGKELVHILQRKELQGMLF